MTKYEILNEIYTDKRYINAIKKITEHNYNWYNDITQELYLILLEKDEQLIIDLYNEDCLIKYFKRICMNMINSKTSPFYNKYRKITVEKIQDEVNFLENIKDKLEKESIYDYQENLEDDVNFLDNIKDNLKEEYMMFDIVEYVKSKNILNVKQFELFLTYYSIYPTYINTDIAIKQSYNTIAIKLNYSRYYVADHINKIRYIIYKQLIKDDIGNKTLLQIYINNHETKILRKKLKQQSKKQIIQNI